MRRLRNEHPVKRILVMHRQPRGKQRVCRVDRHQHIGQGCVGVEAFARLLNDPRFRGLPMLLETPKESGRAPSKVALDRFDEQNLNLLRSLVVD